MFPKAIMFLCSGVLSHKKVNSLAGAALGTNIWRQAIICHLEGAAELEQKVGPRWGKDCQTNQTRCYFEKCPAAFYGQRLNPNARYASLQIHSNKVGLNQQLAGKWAFQIDKMTQSRNAAAFLLPMLPSFIAPGRPLSKTVDYQHASSGHTTMALRLEQKGRSFTVKDTGMRWIYYTGRIRRMDIADALWPVICHGQRKKINWNCIVIYNNIDYICGW